MVKSGSLVIVGGGGMPDDVLKKFIELAGGLDAPIVVLPTSMPDPLPADSGAAFFKRAGAKRVTVITAGRKPRSKRPRICLHCARRPRRFGSAADDSGGSSMPTKGPRLGR